jgi:hypothetical protein
MTGAPDPMVSVLARAALVVVLASGCNQLLGIDQRSALVPEAGATSDGRAKDAESGTDAGGGDASAISDGSTGFDTVETDVQRGDPCLSIHVDTQTPIVGNQPAPYFVASWALYLVPTSDVQAALFSVWAPLHVYDPTYGVFKSAQAHAQPYDHELAAGLEQAGFKSTGCINRASLTENSDLILSLVVVPTAYAPPGYTFDMPGPGGPALVGPTTLNGSLYANGSLLRSDLLQSFPNAAMLYPQTDPPITGSTHLIANFDLMTFMLPGVKTVPGNYGFVLTIESGGAPATQQSAQFTIE